MIANFFAEVSFFEVGLALVTLGLIERGLYRLPQNIVGPGGWLLDTGEAE